MAPADWPACAPSNAELRATLAAGRAATLWRLVWRHRAAGRAALETRDFARAERAYAEEVRVLRVLVGLRDGYSNDDLRAALRTDTGGRFWALVDACHNVADAACHGAHLRSAVQAWHEESLILGALAGLPDAPSNEDLRASIAAGNETAVIALKIAHGYVGMEAGHLHEFDRAAEGLERALQLEVILADLPDAPTESDLSAENVAAALPVMRTLTMLYAHVHDAGGRGQDESNCRAALRLGCAVLPAQDGRPPWNARLYCLQALHEALAAEGDADERALVAAQLERLTR